MALSTNPTEAQPHPSRTPAPNKRLQGMRGRACFRRMKVLRAGPAPLTLVSLGCNQVGARDPYPAQSMLRNRFRSWLRQVRQNSIREHTQHRERHGIPLSVYNETAGIETDNLWSQLEAALDLIASFSPTWLRRMQRMENRVQVRRTPGTRAKLVDERWTILDSYFVDNFFPAQIASSIVHEATHAQMRFCGIPFLAESLAAEERACRRSELRLGRVLQAAGVEGGDAVVERAQAALAAPDDQIGVVVDWNELRVIDLVTRINELPIPRWAKKLLARRQGVLDTPQARATFGG